MKKLAIVFGGGGSKGAYELGVWEALDEMGIKADIAVGTSIGAMMAAFYVQGNMYEAINLWNQLTNDKVMYLDGVDTIDVEAMMSDPFTHKQELISYAKSKGIQIDPLKKIVDEVFHSDLFYNSPIDFGLVTTRLQSKDHFIEQVNVTKKDLKGDKAKDYILASASAFPIFPMYKIDDYNYIDGGYTDNIPVSLAHTLGATHCIVIQLAGGEHSPSQRENEIRIRPHQPLGPFLDFSQDKIQSNRRWGYLDAKKAYGEYFGYTYTFELSQQHLVRIFDECIKEEIGEWSKKYEDYAYPGLQILESIAYDCGVDHLEVYELNDFLKRVKEESDSKYRPLLQTIESNEVNEVLMNTKNKNMQCLIAYYIFDLKKSGRVPMWLEKFIPHIPSDTLYMSIIFWILHQVVESNQMH